jgi:hypothetical protein
MLEIAKLNGKTSNNSIRLVAAMLIISVARLAATTLAILVAAIPLKRGACRATRGCAASSASWFNCIKGVLGKLVNLIAKKF